jgi:uncharacterized RDD family membrane protein YckC
MTEPGQPGEPTPPPSSPPPAAPPPGTPPPTTPPPTTGGDWNKQETPAWVQQAQSWRPADVAAGPAPGIAYADLANRTIAFAIDGVILGVVNLVLGAIVGSILFGLAYVLVDGVLYAAISAGYFVYTWTTMRASPGQRVLNLMTVNDGDGGTLNQNQALTRWFFLFLPAVLVSVFNVTPYGGLGVGILALLSLLIFIGTIAYGAYLFYTTANDPKRQGFHDKQARTVVVKVAPATTPPAPPAP